MFCREYIEFIKKNYPKGTRIRLEHMEDPFAPVPAGTEETQTESTAETSGETTENSPEPENSVDDAGLIHMQWDNGRTLPLIPCEDKFTVISK